MAMVSPNITLLSGPLYELLLWHASSIPRTRVSFAPRIGCSGSAVGQRAPRFFPRGLPGYWVWRLGCHERGRGQHPPPYTLERAIGACGAQLEKIMLAAEQKTKRQKGSWHVRWGITKLPDELSLAGRDTVAKFEKEVQDIINKEQALSGAQFQYQINYTMR